MSEKQMPAGELSNEQKTVRAMAALDTMATIWAAGFDIQEAVKSMMHLPDGEARLIAFIKQGYAEGLYIGRTSHQLAPVGLPQAARDVLVERQRQISAEGWTPERDDRYSSGDMASAAACYATQGRYHYPEPGKPGPNWPWAAEWWKPADYRRNLIKAAALLLAEIERIDRAEKGAAPAST